MDGTSRRGPPSFATQANALLRKNLAFQKRNMKTNVGIVAFPFLVCVLLVVIQALVNQELDKPENRCGCACVDTDGDGRQCKNICGLQYSSLRQAATCPIPSPPRWPALLQVPPPESRASRSDLLPSPDGFPDESCRVAQDCPGSVLVTGTNQSLTQRIEDGLFTDTSISNFSDSLDALSNLIPGTDTRTRTVQFLEPAFVSDRPLYVLRSQCPPNSSVTMPVQIANMTIQQEIVCVQGLPLWRASSTAINNELYKGYRQGNEEKKINEYIAAYDFLNSNENNFNVSIWYNSTYNKHTGGVPAALVRAPRSLNLVSNAYLKFLRGNGLKMQLEFVKEMPKPGTQIRLDFSSLLGPLFFTWIIDLLFPVLLTYLVYEKQFKLRIMMKMHGLGDGPYWLISYAYFLVLSAFYMLCFVIFGSVIGLKFFTLNAYSIQFVFYFVYINLQIVLAFLMASIFSDVKAATVFGYIYVFGSGLLGAFLFQFLVEDASFLRGWVRVMEIVPGFSLFRGLYELSQYSLRGCYMGTSGMQWENMNDHSNGMICVLIIMAVEWLLLLPVAYSLDQVTSLGSGIRKYFPFFLQSFWKKPLQSHQKPSLQHQGSKVSIEMERPDVSRERVVVENLLSVDSISHAIICDNLKKVYPGRDGNPDKLAVRGLSLALPRGECFGMLGPNGAGKTSFINMMIGLIAPSSGTAYVQGLDIRTNMNEIHSNMGVCPQHDLLWETLTGREHLMFYGRLKNLKDAVLKQAVEESLKSVNLSHGGVGDKQVVKYSGGMKRRLSVAITLIGDPKVVYMDEPSTGLDPASRNNLWSVVKHAKEGRAIILTTHSMEEAEVLCDRLGVFVDGSLQCIGKPKELKARYGGSYVFTVTTPLNEEEAADSLVRKLLPSANKIYHIPGTQKFELPKQEVKIADVFRVVEKAKSKITLNAWGLADTTLEDVFIKVAEGAQTCSYDSFKS